MNCPPLASVQTVLGNIIIWFTWKRVAYGCGTLTSRGSGIRHADAAVPDPFGIRTGRRGGEEGSGEASRRRAWGETIVGLFGRSRARTAPGNDPAGPDNRMGKASDRAGMVVLGSVPSLIRDRGNERVAAMSYARQPRPAIRNAAINRSGKGEPISASNGGGNEEAFASSARNR